MADIFFFSLFTLFLHYSTWTHSMRTISIQDPHNTHTKQSSLVHNTLATITLYAYHIHTTVSNYIWYTLSLAVPRIPYAYTHMECTPFTHIHTKSYMRHTAHTRIKSMKWYLKYLHSINCSVVCTSENCLVWLLCVNHQTLFVPYPYNILLYTKLNWVEQKVIVCDYCMDIVRI